MASPVVSGTIALMLQANPALTPNLVKAILQFTAEHRSAYDALTQGAGFLNARGAVELARRLGGDLSAPATSQDPTPWNRHIIWGNHRIGGGMLQPDANAWRTDVTWGASTTNDGESVIWGTVCATAGCDTIGWEPDVAAGRRRASSAVWGASCADSACNNIVWGTTADDANIVWGTACGGKDCPAPVWGTSCDGLEECADNIVWGTSTEDEEDNIVWGTSCERSRRRAATWCGACRPAVNPSPRGAGATPGSNNAATRNMKPVPTLVSRASAARCKAVWGCRR